MRNREQIYGQEAAGLLRNITVYHCIRRDQLLRLYPGKEGVIENLLRYLVKQQRIFYNTDRDCYGDVPDCREDRELTAALWVLLDFIEKVEYHSPDNTQEQEGRSARSSSAPIRSGLFCFAAEVWGSSTSSFSFPPSILFSLLIL